MHSNVQAIILSAEKAGEHDKRLSLFTRERGRLIAFAVGAAKAKARLAAATEPGVESRFRLWMAPGRSVARVTGGALERSFPALRARWSRLTNAMFLCEWTDRLTGLEQPHPDKYDLLVAALAALQTADEATVRLAFLVQFLERSGYFFGSNAAEAGFHSSAQEWITVLRGYDFVSPAPTLPPPAAERLQEQLLKFVSPLLSRPLRMPGYERKLRGFMDRAQAAAAAK